MAFTLSPLTMDSLAVNISAATIGAGIGRRERYIWSHCGLMCHKVDKCYKLYGYPPCFQSSPKLHVKFLSLKLLNLKFG